MSQPVSTLQRSLIFKISGLFAFFALTVCCIGTLVAFPPDKLSLDFFSSDKVKHVFLTFVLFTAIASILLGLVVRLLFKNLFSTLNQLRESTDKMAAGNLTAHVYYDGKDELGMLCESLRMAGKSVKAYLDDIRYTLGKMSNGDFTAAANSRYDGDFSPVKEAIQGISSSLHEMISEIDASARLVLDGSFQVANASASLAAGVISQRSSVFTLSNSVKTLLTQVNQNVGNAASVKRITGESNADVQISRKQFDKLLGMIGDSGKTVADVNRSIKNISDLTTQMNMLSLNAAVEALRIGVEGQAFALVASEINSLAQRCAQAVTHTSDLLEHSSNIISQSEKASLRASQALSTIVEKSEKAVLAANKIGNACVSQAKTIEQAAKYVANISCVVQTNAAIAEQNTAASEELASQSQMLSMMVSHFYAQGAVPPRTGKSYGKGTSHGFNPFSDNL